MEERRRRILLADDDPDALLSLRDRLESFGLEVTTVSTGRDAVDEMRQGGYAMALLDINMPEMDGIAALRLILQFAPEVPIVMITANPQRAAAALEAGAKGFLPKPIDPQRLRAEVDRWTGGETQKYSKESMD